MKSLNIENLASVLGVDLYLRLRKHIGSAIHEASTEAHYGEYTACIALPDYEYKNAFFHCNYKIIDEGKVFFNYKEVIAFNEINDTILDKMNLQDRLPSTPENLIQFLKGNQN